MGDESYCERMTLCSSRWMYNRKLRGLLGGRGSSLCNYWGTTWFITVQQKEFEHGFTFIPALFALSVFSGVSLDLTLLQHHDPGADSALNRRRPHARARTHARTRALAAIQMSNLVTKRWLIVHACWNNQKKGAVELRRFPLAWINRKCPEKSRICRDNRSSQQQWRLWQMHSLICKYLIQERVCGCCSSLWGRKMCFQFNLLSKNTVWPQSSLPSKFNLPPSLTSPTCPSVTS